jgi:hypothetical protein
VLLLSAYTDLQKILDATAAHTSFGKLPLSDEKTAAAFSQIIMQALDQEKDLIQISSISPKS